MTPYYEQDGITIYHGDCRDVLPTIEPVDLVLTDPPYNFGKDYGTHDDSMATEAYEAWCAEWFGLCQNLSQRIIVFPGHGNLPVWWNIRKPSNVACCYKPGNPAPGGSIQFCEWEPWLYWGPFMGGSNVIRATVTKQRDTGDHPCPKPLSLMTALIQKSKAKTIIDPFMGSGTTLRAAKDLGRKAIGIEIEERYCEIAARRLQQAVLPLEIPA
jgi:DNA modification methylase